jgi:ATP-dependent RNA circularization protein (DNA/RNA ligase family)
MKKYHKIQSLFERDFDRPNAPLIEGNYVNLEFEYLKNNQWEFTEKIDGVNIRLISENPKYHNIHIIKGKQEKSEIPKFLRSKLEEKYTKINLSNVLNIDKPVCFYGEGYGNRIQKVGKYYLKDDVDFIIFDILINDEYFLKREDVVDIANKLNLKTVPVIGYGTLDDMIKKVKNGFNSSFGDFQAEGIIAKPKIELNNRMNHRIIAKLKCKDQYI